MHAQVQAQYLSPRTMNPFRWILDSDAWPERWHCGTWSDAHGYTHLLADVAIGGAYFAIPVALLYFVWRRPDTPFPRIFWLFGAFILSCGAGHLIDALMFYQPSYRLLTTAKVTTAIVSWLTLVALVPILPQALALPSIARTNERLARENAARREAQAELRRRNEALQHKTEELEQFVHTVAHDLKSPLVTMGGFLALARHDLAEQRHGDLDQNLERVERASHRLGDLIQGLLDLARVGRGVGARNPVNVEALVKNLVLELHTRSPELKASIRIVTPLPSVPADAGRLSALFENLLVNALQYGCPDGTGEVAVGAIDRGPEVHFFVSDKGPGVAPEHHRRIFGLFQRLARDDRGTGVGLALVEKVARVHGGRAWVESTPGEGSTFWVALPFEVPEEKTPGEADRAFAQETTDPYDVTPWSKELGLP